MRRREFIALLGGATAAWPLAAPAQQSNRMRRLGVLMYGAENDPQSSAWLSGFIQRLAELGWTDGGRLWTDVRWGGDDVNRMRLLAKELIDLQPDVLLANATPLIAELQRQTRTIPIVFVIIADPVGSGFVASLPRPGGNITGFMLQDASVAGKLLELLTKIAPAIKRATAMFNPTTAPYVENRLTYRSLNRQLARSTWRRSWRPCMTMMKSKTSLPRSSVNPEAAWS
jgi:putative tryptophan/tyrosine transport system substrate-binding protein